MKFAKELEQDAVPEWRAKYLDYKTGKKHVKAVEKAVNRARGSPRTPRMPGTRSNQSFRDSPFFRAIGHSPPNPARSAKNEQKVPLKQSPASLGQKPRPQSDESSSSGDHAHVATPMLIAGKKKNVDLDAHSMQYGSFVPTPPDLSNAPEFELPDPALDTDEAPDGHTMHSKARRPHPTHRSTSLSIPASAYEVGETTPAPPRSMSTVVRQPIPRHMSASGAASATFPKSRPFSMKRLLSISHKHNLGNSPSTPDVNLSAIDQVRAKKEVFFAWMDEELNKIETFYKLKEDEAGERLVVLRDQLHVMRNRRIEELNHARRDREVRKQDIHKAKDAFGFDGNHEADSEHSAEETYSRKGSRGQINAWVTRPIERAIENATAPRPGANSRALINMGPSPDVGTTLRPNDPGNDYVRKPHHEHEVPYRTAKRKLKLALKEFYRGLELLKSYALLNRTAFRKIHKKYDKAINAHPPLRYVTEKVNKAWFVTSDVLEGHLHAVEDMYARYFERGNHKIAIGKLRSSKGRPGAYTSNVFRTGVLIGVGAAFAVQGLVYGAEVLLKNPDPVIRTQASYLLQIYGGYFLALYLLTLFTINCEIWNRNKINYVFIFEFDPRSHLDWRELAEFPAFLILLLGFFLWLNFMNMGQHVLFIYYPVILIFVTLMIIFIPLPILFHRSRAWFVYSHWRLLLAGLYPVEFRDFFLGDQFCSLTYLMSNIELFFCLYATHWGNPAQCNSSHSRLLGFFSTLPGIWRAMQCVRRYYDTRAVFPHLVNCGKYSMTITYYVTLSLFRIQKSTVFMALFITFASINAVYCSIWDLMMDWSLLQPQAKHRYLRDVRAYKKVWYYYVAMVVDVLLRFNWVFYIVYTHDLQHNSIASFLIAFSEVSRRGMWTLFRVENEHCANVIRFKASRDVPLPYSVHQQKHNESFTRSHSSEPPSPRTLTPTATHASSRHRRDSRTTASETGLAERPVGALRRRLTKVLAEAHTHDFEKKRKPPTAGGSSPGNLRGQDLEEEDDTPGKHSSTEEDKDEEIIAINENILIEESRMERGDSGKSRESGV